MKALLANTFTDPETALLGLVSTAGFEPLVAICGHRTDSDSGRQVFIGLRPVPDGEA